MIRLKGFTPYCFSLLLALPSLLYAQQDGQSEVPPPANFTSDQSKSDNPAMYLSTDELDVIPATPPATAAESIADNPTDTVIYDAGTQQETLLLDGTGGQESESGAPAVTEPFEGLLPSEILDSQESVLGTDGRVQITATTTYPWRTIVRLRIKYPGSNSIYGCSGAIVDNYHVLTAGHCVHKASAGGFASWIEVYPGQDGSYTPYYRSNMVTIRSYTGWTQNQDPNHDWALVKLDRNIGKWTGWMGRQTAASTSSIYTGGLNTSGYPCDKPSGTQWWDFDSGHSATSYRHFYFMDTFGCQSGMPVWRLKDGNRHILTIHAYGDGSGTPGISNGGTRLNQDKYDRIFSWIALDTAPTDKPDLIDDGNTFSGFSPGSVSPGQSMSAFSDVRNIGTANSGSFKVSYYASSNTTITTFDHFLGQVTVSSITPFAKKDANWNGSLPNNIPAGSYYVGWIIDSANTSNEFNEGNNIAHKSTPKLTVTALSTPSAATLVSPSGSINDTTPTYTWNAVSGSTWYYLWVSDSTGIKIQKWYTSTESGCAGGTGTCSITPATVLATGNATWWIQTYNNSGYGPWSNGMTFNVSAGAPPKATLISPSGSINDTTPTYTWNAVSGSTWYYLWVSDSTGIKIQKWYTSTESGCAGGTGTCSITPATVLATGNSTWWIQTYNNSGYGPWSNGMTFNVSAGAPPKATLISPTGSINDTTPTYSWNAVSGSTWYYLWVNDSSGNKITTWYTSAQVGCVSGAGVCSITPSTTLANGGGTWWIQTYNNSGYGPWSNAMAFTVQ